MKIRALRADEIECRVAQIGESKKGCWCSLLLYKDARCDMNILDEILGSEYWQRDHKELKGNMYAGIGIYNKELCQWVWKWDCGSESKTEAEKGEASDSFKRAGFNWGIGRELYTSPKIFITLEEKETEERNGRKQLARGVYFYVAHIAYSEQNEKRTITELAIKDKAGKTRFSLMSQESKNAMKKGTDNFNQTFGSADPLLSTIHDLLAELESSEETVLGYYKKEKLVDLTEAEKKEAIKVLKAKKIKAGA